MEELVVAELVVAVAVVVVAGSLALVAAVAVELAVVVELVGRWRCSVTRQIAVGTDLVAVVVAGSVEGPAASATLPC